MPNRPVFAQDIIDEVRSRYSSSSRMRNKKRVPDDEVEMIGEEFRQGTQIKTIAERFDRHPGTIYRVLRERLNYRVLVDSVKSKGSSANTNQ